ncbi:carbonic anhydrase family protein [Legionella israelensis]|uniref:Carbonic anhydrase n=1 Tax=Legionella israelensis TaxID=454 RepID=A0A0W0WC16_9GAMM|nr:carbonic anhydrase family protein [Legionella israelensis]KTD29898.1 carbonic anhydrase [Legionella israelensis]QBS10306.1 carbonic anhydrase [Legionella israelensis]QDP73301.1 carbonic anhydrase [Legionella israelensis]SCY49725.1 carbonic anhydrase [Legionella israelensis DSM 19235]STX59906.1 carbonic anhydrase [Legionella israelensis]
MKTITKELQQKITPEQAIELLQKGNQRFIQNLRLNRNLLQQVNETASGQYPFATILSCIDSRTPAELIFDQGLGDIFSIRIAGNVINDDVLGSMEFACEVAGSKLIVVLGHTNCGAIKGACNRVEMEHLSGLLKKIEPAIDKEMSIKGERNGNNPRFVDAVAKLNVINSINTVLSESKTLSKLVSEKKIKIIGSLYDITSGEVSFFNL